MTEEQINKIRQVIKETVNGKIDRIDAKIDAYIKEDNEWKSKAEPVIKMGENVQGFGKVSLYIIGFIASVMGAIIMLSNYFKNK